MLLITPLIAWLRPIRRYERAMTTSASAVLDKVKPLRVTGGGR